MQVYDKAMSEPETCATLCFNLQRELPACPDEAGEEGGADISFRRLLLNKCQEEFEEGDAAMAAVERRERAQQERDAAGVRAIFAIAPFLYTPFTSAASAGRRRSPPECARSLHKLLPREPLGVAALPVHNLGLRCRWLENVNKRRSVVQPVA